MNLKVPDEIHGYNYRIVYFTPNELTVDMKIDPFKADGLHQSIRADGRISELVLAWQDEAGKVHIINGMHRTYCAQMLMEEIPGIVVPVALVDCDEKKFMELRVIASNPHIAIREERVNDWIFEAWKNSDVGKNADRSLIENALSGFMNNGKFEDQAVQKWLEHSAQLWNIQIAALTRIILNSYKTPKGRQITNPTIIEAIKDDSAPAPTLDQLAKLADAYPKGVGRKGSLNSKEAVRKYYQDVVLKSPEDGTAVTPAEHFKERYLAETKYRADNEVKNRQGTQPALEMDQDEIRIQRWEALVRRVANFAPAIDSITDIDYVTLFERRPMAKKRIMDLMKVFSRLQDQVYGKNDPSAEITRLRIENEYLQKQIRQLETLNRERDRSVVVSPSALALSSTDIDKMH